MKYTYTMDPGSEVETQLDSPVEVSTFSLECGYDVRSEAHLRELIVGALGPTAAEWEVPLASEGWREAIVVISGLAPITPYPAQYTLMIEQ